MACISAPIDFLGLNYYRPDYVRLGDWDDLRRGESPYRDIPGWSTTSRPSSRRRTWAG